MSEAERSQSENERRIQFNVDASAQLYYEYWGEFFHLALFDDDTARTLDFAEAFERTHKRYFEAIRGATVGRILEVATGSGAYAEWMARRTTSEVLGVDMADVQLAHARRRLSSLLPNLRFVHHDAMLLSSLEEPSFDAAICLDAACYFPDKQRALAEIATRLAPGATLLLVDWCAAEKVGLIEKTLIVEPFCDDWGIPRMNTVADYVRDFDRAGYEIAGLEDLSDRVLINWERGYEKAIEAISGANTGRMLASVVSLAKHGREAIEFAKKQFYAVILAKVAADGGLLRYVEFVAKRRG